MVLKNFCNKSFLERLISGILLIVIALVTIILGNDILLVTMLLISLIGVFEMYRIFGIEKKATGYIGYAAVIAYYLLLRTGHIEYMTVLFVLFIMCLMVLYVFSFPVLKTDEVMASLFGMIYVAVMISFVYYVRMGENGLYNVWLIFLCSWGSDTCAYVAGVAFGRHKMAPTLSPKKSVEGAAGGIIGAALLGLIYAAVFKEKIYIQYVDVRVAYLLICIVGAGISMVGDLAASAIKRNHDIKDYGKLIPGHGGIMDRFDSVIFVAPVIYLLIELF